MNKLISACFGILMLSFSYGQTYSYSFKGKVSDETIWDIEKRCLEMPSVTSFKARLKSDTYRGEIILVIDESNKRGEADEKFDVKQLKNLLLENNLEPLNFLKLKD